MYRCDITEFSFGDYANKRPVLCIVLHLAIHGVQNTIMTSVYSSRTVAYVVCFNNNILRNTGYM